METILQNEYNQFARHAPHVIDSKQCEFTYLKIVLKFRSSGWM